MVSFTESDGIKAAGQVSARIRQLSRAVPVVRIAIRWFQ